MSLRLIFFAIIYSLISLYFWNKIQLDQSASLGYVFTFLGFWIVSGILLGLLIWISKIKTIKWNFIIFIFCTPVPALLFLAINQSENVKSTYEHNDTSHRIREVEYADRKEYFTSVDLISKQTPFPPTENYKLDSIIYFDKNGNTLRIEVPEK